MLCCAMGIAAVVTGTIGWKRFRRFFHERLNAQSILAVAVLVLSIMTGAALAVEHFRHHAAHASGRDVALLTDPGALPVCRGGVPGDRITDLASIEE